MQGGAAEYCCLTGPGIHKSHKSIYACQGLF